MSTYSLAEKLRPDLLPGERIVWTSCPLPGRLFTAADVFLVPFSLLWAGFTLRFLGVGKSSPTFFDLWDVPFLLIAVYITVGRFVYKAWRKRHTVYAVTDRRVLVLTTTFGRRVQAAFLNTLPGISASVGRDGVGSIVFGSRSLNDALLGNTGWPVSGWGGLSTAFAFYDVPDAARVAAMISERRTAATAAT